MLHIPNFNPEIFRIGPFAIRWYALAYVTGILVGWRYVAQMLKTRSIWGAKEPPITAGQLDDLVLWMTLGIILGGRIGYVLFYQPALIWTHPVQVLRIWDGGMSFHGGLIGVTAALFGFAATNMVAGMPKGWRPPGERVGPLQAAPWLVQKTLALGDLIAPAVPIGLFFGRIANFINGELWGRPTSLPWGMVFCNDNIRRTYAGIYPGGCPVGARHPSQIYEALCEGLILFLVLAWAVWRGGWLKSKGRVVGLFLTGYGVARLVLENFREPDEFMPDALRGHVTMGMLLSAPMIVVGLWLIWRTREAHRALAQLS